MPENGAERVVWQGPTAVAIGLAALVSTSIKLWSAGNTTAVVVGTLGVCVAAVLLSPSARGRTVSR